MLHSPSQDPQGHAPPRPSQEVGCLPTVHPKITRCMEAQMVLQPTRLTFMGEVPSQLKYLHSNPLQLSEGNEELMPPKNQPNMGCLRPQVTTERTDVSILAWFFPPRPFLPQGPRVSVSFPTTTSPISASRPLHSPCWGRGRRRRGPRLP